MMSKYKSMNLREIDVAMAEKLEGYQWYTYRAVGGDTYRALRKSRNHAAGWNLADMTEPISWADLKCPHYSTDFNEALRVLREMDGLDVGLTQIGIWWGKAHQAEIGSWRWFLMEMTPRDLCEAMLEVL